VNGKCFCNARAIGELEQLMGPLPSTAIGGGCLSGAFLFPRHPDKPIAGEMARWQLKRMGYGHITVHGMRATFKTWVAERTRFERHTVEAALAHTNGDKVEAAYLRSDVMEKRRAIMEAWSKYCASPLVKSADTVVPLRSVQ
jgi:integrase